MLSMIYWRATRASQCGYNARYRRSAAVVRIGYAGLVFSGSARRRRERFTPRQREMLALYGSAYLMEGPAYIWPSPATYSAPFA
jgi:hypothetical protein